MSRLVPMVVPQLGSGLDDVEVIGWLVSEGDVVEEGESVVEVEAEKATSELVAPVGGRVARIHVQDGETVALGGLLAEIEVAE